MVQCKRGQSFALLQIAPQIHCNQAMCKQHKIYMNSVTIIYWLTCKSIRLLKKPNYWECVYTDLQYYINIFIYEKCAWFSWDRVINVDPHLHACLLFFTLVRQLGIESSNPRSPIHCIRSRSTFPGFLSQWVFFRVFVPGSVSLHCIFSRLNVS